MDFLSLIHVRGGELCLKSISSKNFVYFTACGETICHVWVCKKLQSQPVFHWIKLKRALFQWWRWQVEGITGNVKWAECSKMTLMVFPDLFTTLKTKHILFSLARWGAFCQGSWESFYISLLFSLPKEENGTSRHCCPWSPTSVALWAINSVV